MAYGYTEAHTEWLAKYAYTDEVSRPSTFEVLLYDDAADDLGASDDLDAITTEPDSGNYSRASLSFPSDLKTYVGARGTSVHPIDAVFDFWGVSAEVDSVGIAWTAQLEDDDSPTNHLMVREQLDGREDLSERQSQYTVAANWRLEPLY